MLVRCLYSIAVATVLHVSAGHGHQRQRSERSANLGEPLVRHEDRNLQVEMGADGSVQQIDGPAASFGTSVTSSDSGEVVRSKATSGEKSSSLLQTTGSSTSLFYFGKTRNLLSFSSIIKAAGAKPQMHSLKSPLVIVVLLFGVVGCAMSIIAAAFNRSPGPSDPASSTTVAGSGGDDEPYVEKDLTCHAESLDEDIYGMGIAAIIRDSQRFAMKTEIFSLRASRLSLSIITLLLTMTLQVFLMYEMKHLVTSVTTHDARDTYDKYEIWMYGNNVSAMDTTVNGYHRGVAGRFNISQFQTLDDALKESACEMPLSQPTFFIGTLLIWTLVCIADMRRVINLFGALILHTPTIDNMAQACREAPEEGDEAVVVVGLTKLVKVTISVVILLPRIIVSGILLWLGCRWLCGTMGFSDVLQNTVTLEFILLLKDLFYNTMAPHHNKVETRNTMIMPNADKQNPNAPVFVGAFAWGLLAIVWVLLYVEVFQQVLPEYNWDIQAACQDYLASVEGKTPGA